MAASSYQSTQGSGTHHRTHTRTYGATTKHTDYVVLDDSELAGYTLVAGNISTATANSHLFEIMAGASLPVRIRRIELDLDTVATTAALMDLRLYRLSTAGTGGSVTTPNPLDSADVASGATGMTLPTAKGTEGALLAIRRPYMMQTIAASTPVRSPLIEWNFAMPYSKSLVLPAGTSNGIALKNVTAIAGAALVITVWFDETPY